MDCIMLKGGVPSFVVLKDMVDRHIYLTIACTLGRQIIHMPAIYKEYLMSPVSRTHLIH